MPAAPCSDLVVRDFKSRDVPDVLAIEGATFRNPLTEKDFRRFLRKDSTKFAVVAVCRGQVVGYLLLDARPQRLEVDGFAVHPGYRRRGVGRRLMGWLTDQLKQTSYERAELTLRETNLVAQLFLRSCRFRATGVIRGYYDEDTKEDAFLFEYRNPAAAPAR